MEVWIERFYPDKACFEKANSFKARTLLLGGGGGEEGGRRRWEETLRREYFFTIKSPNSFALV